MYKLRVVFLLIIFYILFSHTVFAEIDPILLDEPNEKVFPCGDWIFLELPEDAVISYSQYGRPAEFAFLSIKTEFLYLEQEGWNGLDKNSFILVHTDLDGKTANYPLNYVITTYSSLNYGWKPLSFPLSHTTLTKYIIVFDIPSVSKEGWSLIFQPAERGGSEYCRIEIPLKVK